MANNTLGLGLLALALVYALGGSKTTSSSTPAQPSTTPGPLYTAGGGGSAGGYTPPAPALPAVTVTTPKNSTQLATALVAQGVPAPAAQQAGQVAQLYGMFTPNPAAPPPSPIVNSTQLQQALVAQGVPAAQAAKGAQVAALYGYVL